MLKVILHGCGGKMGRTVADCAAENAGVEIVAGVDACTPEAAGFPVYKKLDELTQEADVLIDFSRADALTAVLKYACEKKLPCVIATTGHSAAQRDEIKEAALIIPVFYSANLSLGAGALLAVAKKAAVLLGGGYDIEIIERHHRHKVDAPSGTALMLADGISAVLPEEPVYVYERQSKKTPRDKREIGISSVRGGSMVGEHEVIFAGDNEVLSLTHTAYSRGIFARGALIAAAFLAGKDRGLYDMESLAEASQ